MSNLYPYHGRLHRIVLDGMRAHAAEIKRDALFFGSQHRRNEGDAWLYGYEWAESAANPPKKGSEL